MGYTLPMFKIMFHTYPISHKNNHLAKETLIAYRNYYQILPKCSFQEKYEIF